MSQNLNESRERRRPPVHPSLSEPMPLKLSIVYKLHHYLESQYGPYRGNTPLHEAIVRKLWKKATRMVVNLRADVNIGDQWECASSLHYAMVRGAPLSFIKMMIVEGQAEVGPRIMDDSGGTASLCACARSCMRTGGACEMTCGGNTLLDRSTNNEEPSSVSSPHPSSSSVNPTCTCAAMRGSNPASYSSPILRTALYYDSLKINADSFSFQTVERMALWEQVQKAKQQTLTRKADGNQKSTTIGRGAKKQLSSSSRTDDTTGIKNIDDDEHGKLTSAAATATTTILNPYERLITYDPIIVHSFRCWANHPLVTLPYSAKYNRSRCSDCGALADMCNVSMAAICRPCGYVRCLECVLEQCNLSITIRLKNEGSESSRGRQSEMKNKNKEESRSRDEEEEEEDVSSSKNEVDDMQTTTAQNELGKVTANDAKNSRFEGDEPQNLEKKQSPSSLIRVCALESTRFDSRLSTDKRFFGAVRCETFECVCCSGREFKRGTVYRIIEGREEKTPPTKTFTSGDGTECEAEMTLPNKTQANSDSQDDETQETRCFLSEDEKIKRLQPDLGRGDTATLMPDRNRYLCGVCAIRLNFADTTETLIQQQKQAHSALASFSEARAVSGGGVTGARGSNATIFHPPLPHHSEKSMPALHSFWTSAPFSSATFLVNAPTPTWPPHHNDAHNESNGTSSTRSKQKKSKAMLLDEGKSPQLLAMLIGELGLDPLRARDKEGNTVLHIAAGMGMVNCVRSIINSYNSYVLPNKVKAEGGFLIKSDETPSFSLSPSPSRCPCPLLSAVNMSLITPLHVAAYSIADNISSVIRVLVEEFGADPDGADGPCFGPTPLFLAVLNIGRQNTLVNAETLLSLGASPADVKASGSDNFWARKVERKRASSLFCHCTPEKKKKKGSNDTTTAIDPKTHSSRNIMEQSILEKVSFDCCQIPTSAFSSYERAVVNSRWCARDVMWESSGRPRSFVATQSHDLGSIQENEQVAAEGGNISNISLCLSTRPHEKATVEPTEEEVRRYVGYLKPAPSALMQGIFSSSSSHASQSHGKEDSVPLPKATTDIIDDTNFLFDAYMVTLNKALSPSGNGYALLALVVWSTDRFAIKMKGALLARRFLEHGADVRACVDIGRLFPIGVLLDPTSVALFLQEGLA